MNLAMDTRMDGWGIWSSIELCLESKCRIWSASLCVCVLLRNQPSFLWKVFLLLLMKRFSQASWVSTTGSFLWSKCSFYLDRFRNLIWPDTLYQKNPKKAQFQWKSERHETTKQKTKPKKTIVITRKDTSIVIIILFRT